MMESVKEREDLFSSIMADYINIDSLPIRDLLAKSEKIRCSLKRIIQHHLSDTKMLIKEVETAKGNTTQTVGEMVLNFLHHLVGQYSHAVFAPSSAQYQLLSEEERTISINKYKSFVFWVFVSMLRLLSEMDLKKYHPDILKVILTLLELVKMKNVPMFKILLTEIIYLSVELNQLFEEKVNSPEAAMEGSIHVQADLRSFWFPCDHNMEFLTFLTIQSYDSLNTLRKQCNHLLEPMVCAISQFAGEELHKLWCVGLFQLEHGDFSLKTASLSLLTSLLQFSGLPEGQVMDYFIFCFVSSIEFSVALLNKEDETLTSNGEWKLYIKSVCSFMIELFSATRIPLKTSVVPTSNTTSTFEGGNQNKTEMPSQNQGPQHDLGYEHLSTIAYVLSCEINILKRDQPSTDSLSGENDPFTMFVEAVLRAFCPIAYSTRVLFRSPNHGVTPLHMQHLGFLCDWALGLSDHSDGCRSLITQGLSEVTICELYFFVYCPPSPSNAMSSGEFATSHFPIMAKILEHVQTLGNEIVDFPAGENFQGQTLRNIRTLCVLSKGFVATLNMLSVLDRSLERCDSERYNNWKGYFINSVLNKDLLVKLIQTFLKIMSSKVADGAAEKLYISIYGECVKFVQNILLIIHIAKPVCRESDHLSLDSFLKALTLPFVSLVSLPWLETLKSEDLSADLSASGMQKSVFLPASTNLRKAGLDVSTTGSVDGRAKAVLCDCLKSLAICSEDKYTRWRSMLLIKWGLGETPCIARTALSMLPFFIIKCTDIGSTIFRGILCHIKSICKKMETKFDHTDFFCSTALLGTVISLLQNECVIDVDSDPVNPGSEVCKACEEFKPVMTGFMLKVICKVNTDSATMKRAPKLIKDLLEIICNIIMSTQRMMKGKMTTEGTDENGCMQQLTNAYLRATGKFFGFTDKKNKTVAIGSILMQWVEDLKYYTGGDLKLVFANAVDLASASSSWNQELMKFLEDLLLKSRDGKDVRARVHVIKLIGTMFEKSMNHDLNLTSPEMFSWSLVHLLTQMSSTLVPVQAIAFLELSNLPAGLAGKYLWKDLFQKYRYEICSCLAKSLIGTQPCSGKRPPAEIIEDFSLLLAFTPGDFLRLNMSFILLEVVTSPRRESLLKLFIEITGTSSEDILKQNFKPIFCHAVVSGYDLQSLFSFLEKQIRIKKDSLLLLNFTSLIHHLASHVSGNLERVHEAINVVTDAQMSSAASSSTKMTKSGRKTSLSELLQPHFLGILTFFNCQLRSLSVAAVEKKRILESLTCLLTLMEAREVTSVRVKIINTLCLAQQLFKEEDWFIVCCKAWDTFVRCIEPSYLAPILSQVTVTLLPLLESLPDKVCRILRYMVIERAGNTKEHLHELYFLPGHPALKEICKRVKEEMSKRDQEDLANYLSEAIHLMTHESSEVRVQALTRLRQTLIEKQEKVQKHNLSCGRDVADPIMSKLVSTLLVGCRDKNKQIRLLSGQCLGLIGAIDPDRLDLSLPGASGNAAEFFAIDEPDFAFQLISELVKALLAAEPMFQDISAYAIQEVLKIYDCKDGPRDTHGRRLSRRFSENVREVLEPHHTSRYVMKKSEIPLSGLKQPILFRKPNMTFRDWAGSFCAVLMQMVYEGRDSSTASRVFCACSAVVRNDVNVALFFLPHANLQALLHTDHAEFIVQEVLAVLEQAEHMKERASAGIQSYSRSTKSGSGVEQASLRQTPTSNLLANSQHARGSHLLQLSAQAVFSAFDHITRWMRQMEAGNADSKTKPSRVDKSSAKFAAVKNFLSKIPQLTLARASFRCCAYTRALLHYEAHLRELRDTEQRKKSDVVDEQGIDFLQQLFIEMDEPDGVAGIAAVRLGKPTLSVQIKQLESTGKLQDACACYEKAVQLNPDDPHHKTGYVKCLMDLGQLSTAICVIDGTLTKKSSWKNDLNSYRVEAAWRLGKWDMLEEYLDLPPSLNRGSESRSHEWNSRLGELLLVVKEKKWGHFKELVNEVYQDQTGPLSAASMESGSYQRGYESILRLHMLTELESFAGQINGCGPSTDWTRIASRSFSSWQERLRPVQTSFKPREPVLALQRTMLELLLLASAKSGNIAQENETSMRRLIGRLWLESAKNAREAGYLQTSYNALINAQDLDLPEFCIEHAKWLWHKGESHQALLTLQKGVKEHFPEETEASSALSNSERMTKASAMLLVARLMEESSSFDSNTVLKQFRDVEVYMSEWEDSHFYAAKYYDKLMTAFMGDNRSSGKANHLYYIMHHYGLSLCYGTSHIYESLTKLLTVWLDYEANVAKLQKANKPYNKDDAQRLINVITDLRSRLPAYIFLTAFSQLVSRICHQHLSTFEELKQVVAMVICAYPRQALWTMMAISKSSYTQRAQRCKEIFDLAERKDRKLAKLLSDATRLTDKLLELCNKPAQSIQSFSITTHFKPLRRLVEESSFSEILLPLQRFMTVTLPQDDTVSTSAQPSTSAGSESRGPSTQQHDPFPNDAVYIIGFEDTVEILPSLQRPKKISIRASDGHSYVFLCKPKDDLRKDARLMEFNAIVNKCLKRDSESRKRQLKIRTYAVLPLNEECGLIEWVPHTRGFRHILIQRYKQIGVLCSNRELLSYMVPKTAPVKLDFVLCVEAVVPLNEECGLIEWVPNTQGLRHILLKIYKSRDMYTSGKLLKSLQLPYSAPLEKKLEVFRNKLLPRHPPVFGDWFLATFADPTSWYNARLAYARSTAVMSMVGYILGLGDRHGENILFDSTNGDAVHVDFNCLFNKGLSLDVPEIVPFRLTRNMTDAMGPMRYKGFFQCACEVVMRLLRQQREPLLSVLKTFIYDPLVEWSKRSRAGVANESGEILNEKALSHVSDIDKRLRGIAAKNKGLPLSVEGHVHYLIQEASDEEKLCQMYIGWAPYM